MFRVLRTLGLAFGVLAGIVGAQGPEFAQQYGQRLAGTVDELRRVVAGFEADATATGHTRDSAIARLRGDPDALVARRGAAARADLDRLAGLTARQAALETAGGPLGRLAALIRDPDLGLARATYEDYRPAIPTTADGLVAGFLGFLAAWAGWRVLCDLGRRLFRRRASAVTA
ncbi:MAG: DUF2937 family protein [Methylobacterium sp.]|uniref:DUF2937 family protein n=1 Tax=unclassified Methylobacterium TaxID=2615210 RepID=UPI0006F2C423|nr:MULTISPECIES: DUF2937 family protein [unclassified Methylobacterium]KQP04148.1 hypothetical protein ASF28_19560 [Methylobacterium sp. Leaf99]MDO9429068.1 DUF2937 family protein [Methylobacterium sp.]